MHSNRLRVILDACVLYPAPIRDLLLTFAMSSLFQPLWSDEIQDEWKRNLLANRTDLSSKHLNWTIKRMNDSFPDANVADYQKYISTITLPDKDDRHVVAAAIKGNADAILTFNLKDFPRSALSPLGIEPLHPDQFTLDIIDLNEKSVIQGFKAMVGRLNNPPLTNDDVLSVLYKTGIRKSTNKLQKLLD